MSLITLSWAMTFVRKVARCRIEQPKRAAFDTQEVFREVGKYFKSPQESEGLKITIEIQDSKLQP